MSKMPMDLSSDKYFELTRFVCNKILEGVEIANRKDMESAKEAPALIHRKAVEIMNGVGAALNE